MTDYEKARLKIEEEKLKEMRRTNEINKTSILSAMTICKCLIDTYNKMIEGQNEEYIDDEWLKLKNSFEKLNFQMELIEKTIKNM